MRTATRSFFAISIACALWTASSSAAPGDRTRAPTPERRIKMQFRNAELSEVVDYVSKTTGRAFIFGDSLRGRVTITGDALVTPEETLAILEATLSLQGLAALPTPGGPLRIVQLSYAISSAPWDTPDGDGESETPITTMIHLQHATSSVVITTLKTMVGSSSLALEYPNTNALILAGREGQVRRLLAMVRALDQEDFENLVIRPVRYASATRTAAQLEYMINDARQERPALRVWSDERTNSLLLLASPVVLAQARTVIDEIDRPAEGSGNIRVVPIRHVDPAKLVEELNSLSSQPAPSDGGGNRRVASPLQGQSFNLVVDAPTRSILIIGDKETTEVLLGVIDQLDRVMPRISVDVIVSEISTPSAYRLGFGAFIPLGSESSNGRTGGAILLDPTGGGLQSQGDESTTFVGRATRAPLVVPVLDNNGNPVVVNGNAQTVSFARETVVLVASEQEVFSTILMRPHLLMTSGEQREVFVGNSIPVPVQQTDSGAANPLVVSQSVERQDVGITLRVTPTLGLAGGLLLELEVEVRAVADSVAGRVSDVGPTIQQRILSTKLAVRDGEIMVVGGLTGITVGEAESGVPWLKSLPIIGWLFRNTRSTTFNTTLTIAAQARILRNPSEVLAESIRRRIGFERALARVDELETESPYAVLVTTRSDENDALEIADRLTSESQTAVVSSWEGLSEPRYDVYLTGYDQIGDAGAAAMQIRDEGWNPDVVVLPQR